MANPATAEPATASSPPGPSRTSRRQAEARAVQKAVAEADTSETAVPASPAAAIATTASSPTAVPRRVLPPRKRVSTRADSPPVQRLPLSPVALAPSASNRRGSVSRASALANSARRQRCPSSSRPDSPVGESSSGRTSGSSSRKSTPGSAGLTVNFALETNKPSTLTEPAHALRSVRSVDVMSTIPFPPQAWNGEAPATKKRGGLHWCWLDAEDLKDDRLMATFAALDVNSNRAMAPHEIGEFCVGEGWIRQSPALSPATVISNAIRTYMRRCQTASPPRECLLSNRKLTGSLVETQLASALHPSAFEDNKRPKGAVWYIKGRLGGSAWTDPFEQAFEEMEKAAVSEDKTKKTERPKGSKDKRSKARQAEAEDKRKSSETPTSGLDTAGRRQGRSREGTTAERGVEAQTSEETPRAGLKIRLKMSRPASAPQPVEPVDTSGADEEEDVKPTVDRDDAMAVDAIKEDVKPAQPLPDEGHTETDYSMSDSDSDSNSDSDVSDAGPTVPLVVKFPTVGLHTPPVSPAKRTFPPGVGDSHLFPCNPLDPVSLHELRDSHSAIEDSSSDEDETFSLQGSMLDSFNDCGSAHMSPAQASFFRHHVSDRMVIDDESVDTPATTPRHGSDWERDEKPQPADGRAKEDFDLQNAVQVLGSLLPNFAQSRSLPAQSQEGKPPASPTKPTVSTGAPPPPPTTPVAENRSMSSLSQSFPGPDRKSSLPGSRNTFKLHIPLPRMVASSPLSSPQAHYSARSSSRDPESDIRSAIELLSSPSRGHHSLDDRSSDDGHLMPLHFDQTAPDDECVCEVEDVEMIWEQTEDMTLGDSPPSDGPETMVGSPNEAGFVLMDAANAAEQGAAIDIVNWSRTNHLAEGAVESHDYWIKPIEHKQQQIATSQSGLDALNRDASPIASSAFELDSSASMISPAEGSDLMAPIVKFDDLTKQDWSNLLGPESIGIEELDQVWGMFGDTLVAEAPCTRARRGNSEETIIGGKRNAVKGSKTPRRGRSKTVGEWGHIGVGGCAEAKKEKAKFARALLAKAAVTVSGRSQSRDSRRAKVRVAGSDKADPEDGVGILDLEEAAKDFALKAQPGSPAELPPSVPMPADAEDGQDDLVAFASIQGYDDYYPSLGIPPWLLSAKSEVTTPITASLASIVIPTSASAAVAQASRGQAQASAGPSGASAQPPAAAANQLKIVKPSGPASKAVAAKSAPATGKPPVGPGAPRVPAVNGKPAGPGHHVEPVPRVLVVYPQHAITPSCRAQVVDRIPVFHCVWQSTILLRRIDSDYINVSALLKSIGAPRAKEMTDHLATQPSNVTVSSNLDVGTAGVWVPLYIGREVARTCHAPAPLLDVFLHDNLPDYFPSPLPNVRAAFKTGSKGRSANCFGLPFGSVLTTKTYVGAAGAAHRTLTTTGARSASISVGLPMVKPVGVTATPATPVPSPQFASSAPAATTAVTNKRPSPPAVGDANKPTKRRKSLVAGEVVAHGITAVTPRPPTPVATAPTTAAKAAPAPGANKPAATVVTRKVAAATAATK